MRISSFRLFQMRLIHIKDVGSMRSQSFDSLGGKLLRINPADGKGICQGSGFSVLNPFCDGNPDSVKSKIYALGLRNPFSMNVMAPPPPVTNDPGIPVIGDVGEGGYEEVNLVTSPGMNFGWP